MLVYVRPLNETTDNPSKLGSLDIFSGMETD